MLLLIASKSTFVSRFIELAGYADFSLIVSITDGPSVSLVSSD